MLLNSEDSTAVRDLNLNFLQNSWRFWTLGIWI